MVIKQKKINKPWGYEILWTNQGPTVGKILGINRGQSLVRGDHIKIEENLIVLAGTLTIKTNSGEIKIKRGQSYFFEAQKEYTLSAHFGDVELIVVKLTT
tara:strand:- start:92 stop:391 length:300 start_codon:yes stop_codon:yes gene_type:complete